ncbi:YcaO-like family protein [Streptomyces bobili]
MTTDLDPRRLQELRRAHPLGALVQPHVGLIDDVRLLSLRLGELPAEVISAPLGMLSAVLPHVTTDEVRGGAGSGEDLEEAWVPAVAEAAERYAALVYHERDFVVDSARSLGPAALDLSTVPRCSQRELDDPRCPLRLPNPDQEIRWVRGYSLIDRTERLVPAVMAHLHLQPWPSEWFWLQISTGTAAHVSLPTALCKAIYECIERDAIALTWLGRLPLPRLELPYLTRTTVKFHAFDATTDLGVPTVLSVQFCDGHPHCDVSMSCASACDAETALRKVVYEGTSARVALDRPQSIPDDVADFTGLAHGAHYYGRGGHRDELDFLFGPATTGSPPPLPTATCETERLDQVIDRLLLHGMDAIAIDLTTDELHDVGLWAVKVVIPRLMPISFVHRARYLGTPRLYDHVSRRTGAPFTESDVNPAPLPFA